MAVGGAAGGGQFRIASAFVELTWQDAKYYQGLAKAQQALARFVANARTMGNALNMAGPTASVNRLTASVGGLNAALRSATAQALHLRRALTGMPGLPAGFSSRASMISAYGTAISRIVSGVGRGLGNLVSGFGVGLGSVLRGGGSGGGSLVGSGIRSFGSALAATARGFGSLLSQTLRAAGSFLSQTLRGVSGTVRSILGPLTGLLRGGLAVGGIGGVLGGALGVASIAHQSMAQETRSVRLARVTGGSPEEIDRLNRSLKGLAATLPGIRTDRLYAVAEIGARMGIETSGVSQFAADMAKLGVVLDENELPLEEATNRIGSLLSVFGRGTQDAIRFGSALVKLDQMSTATARDILDITNRFSGPASMFGMTPQQSLALATALRQARVPTETAGTAVGQIMMRMASKKDMPGFAKLSGMSQKQFSGTIQGDPLAAIKAVTKGLAEINRSQGTVAASRALDDLHLDGQRVRGTLLQLAQVFPLLDQYVATANKEWSGLDAVMGGFNRQGQTAAAQLTLMMNQVQLLEIEIGRAAIPIIKGFSDGLGNLAIDLRTITEKHGPQLESFGRRVARVFEYAGTAVRSWGSMKGIVGSFLAEGLDKARVLAGNFFSSLLPFLGNAAKELGLTIGTAIAEGLKAGLGGMGGLLGNLFGGGGGGAPKMGVLGAGIGAGIPNVPGLKFGQFFGGQPNRAVGVAGPVAPRLAAAGMLRGAPVGIHVPNFKAGGFFGDLMAGVGAAGGGQAGVRAGFMGNIMEALGLQRAERGMAVGRQELQGRIGRMVGDNPAGDLISWMRRNIGAPNQHARRRRRVTPDLQAWRMEGAEPKTPEEAAAADARKDAREAALGMAAHYGLGRQRARAAALKSIEGFDAGREAARQKALGIAAGGKPLAVARISPRIRGNRDGPLEGGGIPELVDPATLARLAGLAIPGLGALAALAGGPARDRRRRAENRMPTGVHADFNAGVRDWRAEVNAAFTGRSRRIDASKAGFGPDVKKPGDPEAEGLAKAVEKGVKKLGDDGILNRIATLLDNPLGLLVRATAVWK